MTNSKTSTRRRGKQKVGPADRLYVPSGIGFDPMKPVHQAIQKRLAGDASGWMREVGGSEHGILNRRRISEVFSTAYGMPDASEALAGGSLEVTYWRHADPVILSVAEVNPPDGLEGMLDVVSCQSPHSLR